MKSIVLSGLRFVAFFVASALLVVVAFEGGNCGSVRGYPQPVH